MAFTTKRKENSKEHPTAEGDYLRKKNLDVGGALPKAEIQTWLERVSSWMVERLAGLLQARLVHNQLTEASRVSSSCQQNSPGCWIAYP